MLARLEKIEGVREARVDWTGRFFLVSHGSGVDSAAVVASASRVLGPTTQRLAPAEERQQIESFESGAPWLRAGETARLSKHEAETLATRYATAAARSIGLDEVRVARVVELAQDELVALFKRFESTGLPSRDQMTNEWAGLIERVKSRTRAFLTGSEAEGLGEALKDRCVR